MPSRSPTAHGPGSGLPDAEEFTSRHGLGVTAVVGGHAVAVGRASWLEDEWTQRVLPALAARAAEAEAAGQTAVFAGWDGRLRGMLVIANTVKPTSADAIARLRGMGLRPVLLTGDNERAARAVASQVGIEELIAGVLPAGKAAVIKELQAAGRVVAMAGDGVNDAAALAQADLGLAIGTGTDAAIEASDLTLVRGDLRAVPDATVLSRRTLATIKGNLFWAFAYNTAAIPLAALGCAAPGCGTASRGGERTTKRTARAAAGTSFPGCLAVAVTVRGSGVRATCGRQWRTAGGGPRPRRRARTQKPASAAAPSAATASVVASPLRGSCSS